MKPRGIMDDLSKTTKEYLIEAILLAEARLRTMSEWEVSDVVNVNELRARMLELEAWAAEPNLLLVYGREEERQ